MNQTRQKAMHVAANMHFLWFETKEALSHPLGLFILLLSFDVSESLRTKLSLLDCVGGCY